MHYFKDDLYILAHKPKQPPPILYVLFLKHNLFYCSSLNETSPAEFFKEESTSHAGLIKYQPISQKKL